MVSLIESCLIILRNEMKIKRFLLKHKFKFFGMDFNWHSYDIYNHVTGELLLKSLNVYPQLDSPLQLGSPVYIKLCDVKDRERISIEKRSRVCLFSPKPGTCKYHVYDTSNNLLGSFQPGPFIYYGCRLHISDSEKNKDLYVKRKFLFGFEWSFFWQGEKIATLKRNENYFSSYFKEKTCNYVLEILDDRLMDTYVIWFIFAIIICCRHGNNHYSSYGRF